MSFVIIIFDYSLSSVLASDSSMVRNRVNVMVIYMH